ncbi:golgin subfamily A member 4 isoform X2 [Episyrphus balteatus]|uniref:golgin subfamily A member 4 isoform X2 n=1 Tax=Episyrphus balteatus TaxID=286459 RepID=UPI0024869057|nr:golgin subfamily A member 4 isoform X2 [Episyrphus balteatus]
MHHLYSSSKGDQLCPLGFHPQVRWPTRCKRCFRDYKEHGGKRGGDDVAASSPNLSDGSNAKPSSRSWTSTQNLSTNGNDVELKKRPQSWTSTPDLDEKNESAAMVIRPVENNVETSLKVQIPPRRHTTTLDLKELEETVTLRRPSSSSASSSSSTSKDIPDELVIQYNDSLAERMRKMNLLKKQKSLTRDSSRERSVPKKEETSNSHNSTENNTPPDRPERRQSSSSSSSATDSPKKPPSAPKKSTSSTTSTSTSSSSPKLPSSTSINSTTTKSSASSGTSTNSSTSSLSSRSSASSSSAAAKKESDKQRATKDVEFMLKIKDNQKAVSERYNDNASLTTETTDTTIIGTHNQELHDELRALRADLDAMRSRAERAERDKSDILLRRLASIDTGPNRTAASEALSLQQRVNELKSQLEKVQDEKRSLNTRLKEIENGPKSAEYEMKRKLQAAEQLCEELMEENTEVKRELRGLEAEMEEMHDSFRDTQAEVNTTLQKQLESTTKNCRILSFKLKKCERKIESLEQEKQASCNEDMANKIKKLEEELRFSNELSRKLQSEADELRNPGKKKPPMLGVIGKSTSADGKFTRESLTRGGSHEDPQQLMRDLQDSIERESDLKDQLKFSEQENERLRQRRGVLGRFNQGTQTDEVEVLYFPRGTQTRNESCESGFSEIATQSNIEMVDSETSTEIITLIDEGIQVEEIQMEDKETNIDESFLELTTKSVGLETNDISFESTNETKILEEIIVKVSTETQTEEVANLPLVIKISTESQTGDDSDKNTSFKDVTISRESSPCGSFMSLASSANNSLLFPSVMSRAWFVGGAGRKLSPTPNRLTPEPLSDRDEGISDEDDPAELRILLELNEQEASILRLKVEDLEKENTETKKQVKELQSKLQSNESSRKLPSLFGSNSASDKKLKAQSDELATLRKSLIEKDRQIERLQAEISAKTNGKSQDIDSKRHLDLVEQEAAILRSKLTTLETENEKLLKDNKRMQLQALRKPSMNGADKGVSSAELISLKESLSVSEKERDELSTKLKLILQEAEEKLPQRTPRKVTDLTPKNHLKKWFEELEEEIKEMRAIVLNSNGDKVQKLETEKTSLEKDLKVAKEQLAAAENDLKKMKGSSSQSSKISDLEQKLKKSDEESKKLNTKIKDLEDKIKKQDTQIKLTEAAKTNLEAQSKKDKEKLSNLEKEYEKERKEREKWEAKVSQLDDDLTTFKKSHDKTKTALEKEIKDLKSKSSNSKSELASSKQIQDLKKQIEDLQTQLTSEQKRYTELNAHWETLSEETILMRAQLSTEKENLQTELMSTKQRLLEMESIRTEKSELAKRLKDLQKKLQDLESKNIKAGAAEYEKTMLKNTIAEKEREYDRLRRENEMNIDLVFQLRKDNDDLNQKLSDFSRIEQAQSSINGHNAGLQNEIKSMKIRLENAELNAKSEVASTRLRYEQQVKNLSAELTSMQRQCERFKKDRDTFKQLLESAQKKIGDLKANTGRQSRGSMHSSDDDDKSKIAYLEQQIGCLEDQLCEARLDVSKFKTELVSERSANEIKISEMRSKLNEFEEERVIGSGRTKIPGMKTKLELSWQKEREDQQRLLQETSTLARDLRQTLFEVERERDKERLESKRRSDQLRRSTEEELEEGRKKIAELQCDLLELRDVHAKLRTSNEKLRRERERYEKELIKRRMEHDGGERKVGALLQTVDELVKIAPDLKLASSSNSTSSATGNRLKPDVASRQRSRSPSPTLSSSQISSVLARLAEASEELRKFQRIGEEENERSRLRRSNLRRAASQENDAAGNSGQSTPSRSGSTKLSRSTNGSLYRKSLSLDHSIQQDQAIWRQDDGSVSSMQSIDSEMGGMVRDSSMDSRLDSRLSGGSTQSDIPRGPRKKKKSLMGKLRSLTKSSRNSESEISVQGSDSDISVASDMRSSKKDLRGRLSGMFRRSGSATRSASVERPPSSNQPRPVAVTVVGDENGPGPHNPPPPNATTPKPIRSISKPPTPTTPITKRRTAK